MVHPFNCNIYYASDQLIILITEGISHEWKIVSHLTKNIYIYNIIPWNMSKLSYFQIAMNNWKKCTSGTTFDYSKQLIWLVNTEEQHNYANQVGFTSLFINHNAWLDYNMYKISNNNEHSRLFDAVINSRPFKWKRIYLADNIKNLALIKGSDYSTDPNWKWNPWYRSYKFVNIDQINQCQVIKILNSSKMGLILSGNSGDNQQVNNEGACYSSSEYLLCGLPVLSTISEGGRDIWYNSDNSVICEPNIEDVYNKHCMMLSKINNNEYNREKIRSDHIDKQDEMRQRFIDAVNDIFNIHGIIIDSKVYFEHHFFNKMTNYKITEDQVLKIFDKLIK